MPSHIESLKFTIGSQDLNAAIEVNVAPEHVTLTHKSNGDTIAMSREQFDELLYAVDATEKLGHHLANPGRDAGE